MTWTRYVPGPHRRLQEPRLAARSTSESTDRQAASRSPDADNYYQMLAVPYTASAAEITKAYREAMKRFHPDRVRPDQRPAAEELSKDLNRAYKTLSNPIERVAYDRTVRVQEVQDQIMRRYVGGFAGPGGGGVDPFARTLKRDLSPEERADRRRSERSAMVSLLAIFVVVALGAIGLILIWALVSFAVGQVF